MKVYINKPRSHWLSPYTILEKIVFWREIEYNEPAIERWSKILTPFSTALMKILDFVHPQVNWVRVDKYDTWSMDHTLTPIILPMLIQLKAVKHGAPNVDDEDVPANLRSTTKSAQKSKENDWDPDGNHFRRWDWVMGEMIWAFTQMADDESDAQFHTGVFDQTSVPCEWDANGKPMMYEMKKGPKHTAKWDKKGHMKHHARVSNGTRLFGKYYQSLWD